MAKRKDVPYIIRGAGWAADFVHSVVTRALERGLPEEIIHRLVTPEGEEVLDQMVDVMVQKWGNIYTVNIDYSQTVEELVQAGKYDWFDSDISGEHFPSDKTGEVTVEFSLYHHGQDASTEEILKGMDEAGLRPAGLPIHGILSFGTRHPDLQRRFPIVDLDSVWARPDGYRYVPCLYSHASRRRLDLFWYDRRWNAYYRFLAVRKS